MAKKKYQVMDTADAFQIVYDLAEQNALDPSTCDKELIDEARKQQEALGVAHDFIVNQLGDD